MSVTIEIPTAFRRFTNGAPKVDCSAATVAEAASSSTSTSTKKTSASSAANPAPLRKATAFCWFHQLREDLLARTTSSVGPVTINSGAHETQRSPDYAGRRDHHNILCTAVFYKHETSASHLRRRFPASSGVSCASESGCFPVFRFARTLDRFRRERPRSLARMRIAYNKLNCLFSSSRSIFFVERPPPNPVRLPSLPTTRWHGTMMGMGLLPFAKPTARTALGLPMRSASCA
jgi:hypothetical protein